MEGDRGILGVYGMEWSGFAGRDAHHKGVSLRQVNEMNWRHVNTQEAPGRVERGMQQITEAKILGSFT